MENIKKTSERGMTLIEIMVVVVIISLVAGFVGISVLDSLEDAKHDVAYTEVRKIAEAVELYKLKLGKYPATGEGLQALSNPGGNARPFLKDLRSDPWGNAYVYVQPGTHNTHGFDILSYGVDGVQGGSDDVGNWQDATENKQAPAQ